MSPFADIGKQKSRTFALSIREVDFTVLTLIIYTMILFNVKKNKNEKMPNAYGKYYAYPVVTQTLGIDGLATHMSSHNTPFSPGAIKGMLTDMVICIRELALQGIAVKIDNLAIFSIGIKNKQGADTEKDFSVAKNIEGVKLRARATGELVADRLNLDATLKKATALAGSDSTDVGGSSDTPTTPSSDSTDTPSSGGTDQGGGSGTGSDSGSGSGTGSEDRYDLYTEM